MLTKASSGNSRPSAISLWSCLLSIHQLDKPPNLPQDWMEDVEMVKPAKLLDLREEGANGLWMSAFCDIAVDYKTVKQT